MPGRVLRMTPTGSLLVLAALGWEAAVVRAALPHRRPDGSDDVRILACGIGEERAAVALAEARPAPDRVVLVGCAGALDPRLRAGDLVVADRIVEAGGEILACDAALRQVMEAAARRAGLEATVGGVLGSATVVASVDEKRRAARSSGCIAVDMESVAVARYSARRGIPSVVVRAVLDSADVALEYAPLCVDPAGGVSIAGLGRALVSGRGRAVRELLGLAAARRAATETLRRFHEALFERALEPPQGSSGIAKRRTDR